MKKTIFFLMFWLGFLSCSNNPDPKLSFLQEFQTKMSFGDMISCEERGTACPQNTLCQKVTRKDFSTLGYFCIAPQSKRDGECFAYLDKNACTDNRQCLPSRTFKKKDLYEAESFVCRESCLKNLENCPANETCLELDLFQDVQPDAQNANKPQLCLMEDCENGRSSCPCDMKNGYLCEPYFMGFHACLRHPGICVEMVPWASHSKNIQNHIFVGQTCNEKEGHRFCPDLFDTENGPEKALCMPLKEGESEGVCLALCSMPEMDYNGNGELEEGEWGFERECPMGYTCETKLARELGFVVWAKNEEENFIPCDPEACVQNEPCIEQCGEFGGECLAKDFYKGELTYFCGAPMGSCEPW